MDTNDLRAFELECKAKIYRYLDGYSFEWSRHARTAGMCLYGPRLIQVSRPIAALNSYEDMLPTLFHEVAHGLAGHAAGHGPKWRKLCLELGGNGQRTSQSLTVPIGKWQAKCLCGKMYSRIRKPAKGGVYYCPRCPKKQALLWTHVSDLAM